MKLVFKAKWRWIVGYLTFLAILAFVQLIVAPLVSSVLAPFRGGAIMALALMAIQLAVLLAALRLAYPILERRDLIGQPMQIVIAEEKSKDLGSDGTQ